MDDKLQSDLKAALLAGDKEKVETLRNIKSAFLYEAVSLGVKDQGLSEEQAQKVLAREAKKRTEAADLYQKAGETQRADKELKEKQLIYSYLPQQLSEEEIQAAVSAEIKNYDPPTMADMGKIIGEVKLKLGVQADGATIARLVKATL